MVGSIAAGMPYRLIRYKRGRDRFDTILTDRAGTFLTIPLGEFRADVLTWLGIGVLVSLVFIALYGVPPATGSQTHCRLFFSSAFSSGCTTFWKRNGTRCVRCKRRRKPSSCSGRLWSCPYREKSLFCLRRSMCASRCHSRVHAPPRYQLLISKQGKSGHFAFLLDSV